MQLNTLKREHPNKKARLVGRGGTRGKTSGRGGKGQTARAGNKRRPELRDIIKKLPKLRGYRFKSFKIKPNPINIGELNVYKGGETVNPKSLFEKKLIEKEGGNLPKVKILGSGEINIKITVENCEVSSSARAKIEKAGGTIK
ncbi:TPA: 50S ribosomal protein L15 [Candidatus Nomurabacteria bacterium]|nr:MAG: 50S ribosomal protein L15 [Parcubacteria bacterium RAAC4_OD1_1]HCY26271.1 50S ribosomal protein L15 [Candidatus Nomurabacteria bacterium]